VAGSRYKHGFDAVSENGPAASELRRRCVWLHHGSGLLNPPNTSMWAQSLPPQARSPRVRHPDRTKCTGVLGAVKNEGPWGGAHAPFLTAPARAGSITRKVGMKKRAAPGRTKKLRDNKMDRTLPLDKNCPIQACSFSDLASATARHTPNTNAPSMVRRRRRLGGVLDLGHQSASSLRTVLPS
jgi:hypothetical protein